MTPATEEISMQGAVAVGSGALLGVETAKVYRAGGRRWFTKRAACRALARQAVNERCECEPMVYWGPGSCDFTPGQTCWYHKDPERLEKILRRLTRIYMHVKMPNVVREPSRTHDTQQPET
jgi:hypothetical protein